MHVHCAVPLMSGCTLINPHATSPAPCTPRKQRVAGLEAEVAEVTAAKVTAETHMVYFRDEVAAGWEARGKELEAEVADLQVPLHTLCSFPTSCDRIP